MFPCNMNPKCMTKIHFKNMSALIDIKLALDLKKDALGLCFTVKIFSNKDVRLSWDRRALHNLRYNINKTFMDMRFAVLVFIVFVDGNDLAAML